MNNRIREIRKDHNMSMRAFGNAIGVSSSAISQFEHNENGVSNQTITSICREFDVNPDWLVNGVGPKYISNDVSNKASAWVAREFSGDSDSFQKRFLAALSRLSPEQWDMIESFMTQIITKKDTAPVPEEPEQSGEETRNDTSSATT